MGSGVKLFLASGLSWLRTSPAFETRAARLKAVATPFQPMAAEVVLPGRSQFTHPTPCAILFRKLIGDEKKSLSSGAGQRARDSGSLVSTERLAFSSQV